MASDPRYTEKDKNNLKNQTGSSRHFLSDIRWRTGAVQWTEFARFASEKFSWSSDCDHWILNWTHDYHMNLLYVKYVMRNLLMFTVDQNYMTSNSNSPQKYIEKIAEDGQNTFTFTVNSISRNHFSSPSVRAPLDDWWQNVGQVLVCKKGWSRSRQSAQTRHMWDGNCGLFIAENYNYLQWHIAIHFSKRSIHSKGSHLCNGEGKSEKNPHLISYDLLSPILSPRRRHRDRIFIGYRESM